MSSLNKVQIIGRLGQDPELKNLQSGDAVCTLSVATSEKWTDKGSGEKKEKTEWHRIVLFGRQAEVASQYLKKGSLAYFEGKIETRKWTDQQGVERYSTEIKASTLQLLGGRDDQQSGGGAPQYQQRQQQGGQQRQGAPAAQRQPAQQQRQAAPSYDDEIPF